MDWLHSCRVSRKGLETARGQIDVTLTGDAIIVFLTFNSTGIPYFLGNQ
jgi:hypothetical protein